MKKTLVLLLVASLLLAGCTELISSDDDEVKKIEVNEDIAIEKINDFITVDEDESFGITMMYDMDPSVMDSDGFLEFDEDSDAMISIEMTEAWSPDGYHFSTVMGLTENGATIQMAQSYTQIGTTIYTSIGYETIGDVCANEDSAEETEACEMQVESIPATQFYSMEAANTHTELIAAMAEETADNSDDMDPMEMLEFFTFVECMGTFTPADSVDGLQVYDVAMEGMDEDSITPELALCMFDSDNSNGISFEEMQNADDSGDEGGDEDLDGMQSAFDEADSDGDGELAGDELDTFIGMMNEDDGMGDEDDDMGDDSDSEMMPNMAVAFNDQGEIEYFEMEMEGTMMKMYVLTEDRVASFFTDVDAGELVALPFEISSDLDPWAGDDYFYCDDGMAIPMSYVNDGMEDCAGGEDEMDMSDDHDDHDHGDHGDDHDDHDHGDHGDDHDDHHDDEFTCDDGDTIPMYWVNDGEEDCVGGEDEGYVWTYNYDNCADSDDGLSSLDCWTNEMDVDGDGTPEDSDSYWNYECEQLADGTWECGTDHINYYDNCAYEAENYYECWLDEWDTDNNGSYDLGSDGYMDYECEQLADGRWACGHSEDMEAFQNYDNCDEEAGMYECWDDDWVDSDGNVAITDGYELADCSQLEDGTWDCLLMDEDGGSPTFICGNGEEIPFEYVNDGGADCADGADEQQYDSDGNEINWFDCMDGSQVWISQVNDGTEDCPDGEDEMPEMGDDDDIEGLMSMLDSDDDGIVTWAEYDAFVVNQDGGWESDDQRDAEMAAFNEHDTDSSGGLDADEFAELIMSNSSDDHDDHDHGDHGDDHGDEDMVCYDMSTHSVDHSIDNQADCEDAGYMWTEDQSDDHDGHDHGDDHDDHDHGDDHDDHDHGDHSDDSHEVVMYITSDMDFHFEGDMSDYKIELATCDEDYDWDTGESTKTCTTVMSVAIADVGSEAAIMFHDADSSGTISVGDMIHIGATAEEWDTVRLYSISADAYSDENPMLTVPGFTGLVGMLALLGAAFIRRNE